MNSSFAKWILPAQLSLVVFGISACEIRKKGAKDPDYNEQGTAAVLGYFILEQAAISNPDGQEVRAALSSLVGRAIVATDTSTFVKWYEPELGCRNVNAAYPDVTPTRVLDVGDLQVKDPGGTTVALPKDPKEFYFSASGLLNPGSVTFQTTGNKGSFAIAHTFNNPDMGSNIAFERVDNGEKESLPAPLVVAPPTSPQSDPNNYYVSLNRRAAYRMSFHAPAGTNYVRLTIADSVTNDRNWVVCYGRPGSDLFIPEGALEDLAATDEAYLSVDFMNTQVRKDIPRMKESVVIAYSRHRHGKLPVKDPVYWGRLSLE